MCLRPIAVHNPLYQGGLVCDGVLYRPSNGAQWTMNVPCGNCPECLRQKQNDLAYLCNYECERNKNNLFFTLTYDQQHVPTTFDPVTGEPILTIQYDDFKRFIKRFRYRYNLALGIEPRKANKTACPIKYLACSEYGSKTHRPHFHFILHCNDFNPLVLTALVHRAWRDDDERTIGIIYTDQKQIGKGAAYYVSKYCYKPNGKTYSKEYDSQKLTEFNRDFIDTKKVEKPRSFHSTHYGFNCINPDNLKRWSKRRVNNLGVESYDTTYDNEYKGKIYTNQIPKIIKKYLFGFTAVKKSKVVFTKDGLKKTVNRYYEHMPMFNFDFELHKKDIEKTIKAYEEKQFKQFLSINHIYTNYTLYDGETCKLPKHMLVNFCNYLSQREEERERAYYDKNLADLAKEKFA